MSQPSVLVLSFGRCPELTGTLFEILEGSGLRVDEVDQAVSARPGDPAALRGQLSVPDRQAVFLVLTESRLDLARLRSVGVPDCPVPVFAVSPERNPEDLLSALRLGVTDFILTPLTAGNVLPRLWRAVERRRSAGGDVRLAKLKQAVGLKRLIGESPAFLEQTRLIPIVARSDVGVLISGETGTGKEVVARTIHYLSPRAKGPFVPVNCGAIPVELIENELFGHQRSAFTGASSTRAGLLEEADNGTLLLDEIDCLPLLAQVKLLRFLQDGQLRRLGSTRLITSDCRVIAASNVDVEQAVEAGRLRGDLYYRLNVIPIRLPPLRARSDDVRLFCQHFLKRYSRRYQRPVTGFTDEAMELLLLHDWPGNVRELQHVVQRAVLLSAPHNMIERGDILFDRKRRRCAETLSEAKSRVLGRCEKRYIERMLAAHRGNITHAAQAADRSRRGFWGLIQKHQIDVERFRHRRA